MTLQRFGGEHVIVPKLNALVDAINSLRGDGIFISVSPAGIISLNWQAVAQRVPRTIRSGGAGGLAWAAIGDIFDSAGDAWEDWTTSGYQAFASANPVADDGTVDTGTTIYLQLTDDAADAYQGYERFIGGEVVPYHPSTLQSATTAVPGVADTYFAGIVQYRFGKVGMIRAL